MIEKTLVGTRNYLVLLLALGVYLCAQPKSGQVLGVETSRQPGANNDLLAVQTTISVKTSFTTKQETVVEEINFSTAYQNDNEMEYGQEKILEQGVNGIRTTYYAVTFWLNDEVERQITKVGVEQPKTQLIAKGTKIIWRELKTEVGKLKYWRKLHVWATKYDGNCYGCRGLTYSGTLVRKGVCAVDPKVISLGTNFYVEGYGICRSEDIGGGIKGNEVDLGFEDASKAAWGAAYTNVYLLTSVPEALDE